MSEKENYQKHIELAIQNVLKKVKNPEFDAKKAASSRRTPEHTHTSEGSPTVAELARARPVVLKNKSPLKHNQLSKPRPVISRASKTRPLEELPEESPVKTVPLDDMSSEASGSEDITTQQLIDGEDLYTPVNLEPAEELPDVEADPYEAPYNLFEEFVETELDILLARYVDLCHCSQCRSDMVALALQQLPAYYVTGTRGTLTAKSVVWTRYMQEIMDAMTKAIHIVYKRPRSSCKRIKHTLWVKPDLEEVKGETGESEKAAKTEQFVDTLSDEEPPDLNLSDEITEIIQTLEKASATELLPVFSEMVHRDTIKDAYQTYEPEEPPEDMQLLEIDDWE